MAAIALERTGAERIRLSPAERLGSWLPRFLEAVRQLGLDHKEKLHYTAPAWRAADIVEQLRAAGFQLILDDVTAASLAAAARSQAIKHETAEEAVARREADLSRRGLRLLPYQRRGSLWLLERLLAGKGGLLADQMGLGKTWQILLALPDDVAGLIYCPASVKGPWLRLSNLLRPDLFSQVITGAGRFRWPLRGTLLITNYDVLPRIERRKKEDGPPEVLPPAPEGIVLIGDECHAVQNGSALRTRRFRALSRLVRAAKGIVVGASGTPINNHEEDLWGVCYSLDLHEEAFDNYPTFQRLFDAHKSTIYVKRGTEQRLDHTGRPVRDVTTYGAPLPEVAERLRRVMLRRRIDDVLPDLPEVRFRDVVVELPNDAKKICDEALEYLTRRGISLKSVEELVEITRPGGVPWQLISKARAALAVAKIGVMRDLILDYEAQEEPLALFSVHRAPIDAAAERSGWQAITGDVDEKHRTELVERFQRGELRGLALTVGAGGEGITLTRAAHAMRVDLWWNPAKNNQVVGRLRRIGAARPILVTDLVADHALEKRVRELTAEKQQLFDATIEVAAVRDEPAPRPPLITPPPPREGPAQGGLFG